MFSDVEDYTVVILQGSGIAGVVEWNKSIENLVRQGYIPYTHPISHGDWLLQPMIKFKSLPTTLFEPQECMVGGHPKGCKGAH